MMIETIREASALIRIKKSPKISKEMDVFYNPVMKANRDISILVLKALGKKKMNIGLPLEGTGIRGIRFLKELGKGQINLIAFNDYSEKAVESIKRNLALNAIDKKSIEKRNNSKMSNKKIKNNGSNNKKEAPNIELHCEDANLFLLNSKGFDYIDVDPFGTSNPFLDSAIKRIARNGILAVTNTDTASLAGTYPKVCKRLYWATPKHDYLMHEIGLRILIRKMQLIGAQHDKALIPVFSYFKDHYFRIFFECVKSKDACDEIISKHGMFENAGPLWLGQLWDSKLADTVASMIDPNSNQCNKKNKIKKQTTQKQVNKGSMATMIKNPVVIHNDRELAKFLGTIKEESIIPSIGFFDTHTMSKSRIIRKDTLIEKIKTKGYHACSTHFLGTAIRTDVPRHIIEKLAKI